MAQRTGREIHTVFGAGQVGVRLARLLAAEGKAVRLVRRARPGPAIPGVVWLQGDVLDSDFADAAADGARVVYNTTNPRQYHRWDRLLRPLYRAVWNAAARAGARLVQLDNLYAYGRPPACPFDEDTPVAPLNSMGRLRAELAEELLDEHARGRLRATIARASDFFGPELPRTAVFRPGVLRVLVRGGRIHLLCNPDTPHGYSYVPDVVRGLAVLGRHDEADGRAWHLPVAARVTTRALLERFAARAGTRVTVRRVPRRLLRLAGSFVPVLRAVVAMDYQWEIPYVPDDGRIRRAFGVEPTDLDAAIDATLAAVGGRVGGGRKRPETPR